jgi:hypothetical protein
MMGLDFLLCSDLAFNCNPVEDAKNDVKVDDGKVNAVGNVQMNTMHVIHQLTLAKVVLLLTFQLTTG